MMSMSNTMSRAVAAVLSCYFAVSTGTNAATRAPLSSNAAASELDGDMFVGIQPSLDGEWLAFDTSDTRESISFEYPSQTYTATGYPMWASGAIYRAQLMNVGTGEVVKLSSERGVSWGGSWSPDGRQYAFYSDRDGMAAVWVWDRQTRAVRKVSDAVVRMFRNNDRPEWTADGASIVFKTVPEGMTLTDLARINDDYRRAVEKAGSSTQRVNVYTTESQSGGKPAANGAALFDYRFLSDLVIVDVKSGALRTLAKRVRPLRHAVAPDGKYAAILNAEGLMPNTQQGRYSLRSYSLSAGTEKILDDYVLAADPAEFSWSPRGDRIAYASRSADKSSDWVVRIAAVDGSSKIQPSMPVAQPLRGMRWGAPLWNRDASKVYVLDTPQGLESVTQPSRIVELPVGGGTGKPVGSIADRRIDDIVVHPSGDTYWSEDGASMVLRTHDPKTKRHGFHRFDLGSGKTTQIAEYDARIHFRLLASPTGPQRVAFFKEDATHPLEIHMLDVRSGKARQISQLHPELNAVEMGRTRLIDWRSAKGEPLQGTLLLPPGYRAEQRVPLVVWMYGGRYGSDDLNKFGFGWGPTFNMQMLATRGYAVLYPDVPLHVGTPIDDVVDAVIPGVNAVIDLGVADPERLAVMGQSFGGYNTVSLITRTQRFKAAVITGSAPIDLFGGYSKFESGEAYGIGYYEQGQGNMRATPWEKPLRYLENSPSFFLERVQTPLLIIRGTDDSISAESGGIFAMLRRLGKTAELREYEGEGHVLQRPDNIADAWQRRLEWLDTHLNGGTAM